MSEISDPENRCRRDPSDVSGNNQFKERGSQQQQEEPHKDDNVSVTGVKTQPNHENWIYLAHANTIAAKPNGPTHF